MRRTDSLKVLFVCVCVCTVCPAHPCGDNPLLVVDHFSRTRGLRSEDFMHNLRMSTPGTYTRLMNEYQAYMECTRAVQTGYYKRSVDNASKLQTDHYTLDPFGNSNSRTQVVTNLLKDAIRNSEDQRQQEQQSSDILWKKIDNASNGIMTSSAGSVTGVDTLQQSSSPSQNKDLPLLIKRILRGLSSELPQYDLTSSILTPDDGYTVV